MIKSIVEIATGETSEPLIQVDQTKPAPKTLGRMGGLKGATQELKLLPKKRIEIAKKAAAPKCDTK